MIQLEEIFGATIPHRIIGKVYDHFEPDLAACVEELIGLSNQDAQPSGDMVTYFTSVEHAAFSGLVNNRQQPAPEYGNLWESLTPDCQVLIANRLTLKDLAAASLVCKSMARYAALALGRCDVVRCNCSVRSIAGMIRCHKNASQVWTLPLDLNSGMWPFEANHALLVID